MIKKIYLDMDGVLCNFEQKYIELFGKEPAVADRNRKEWSTNWDKFCLEGHFENLCWFPGGIFLLDYVERTNITIEILSSSGGKKYHDIVEASKKLWLKQHNIPYKANIVPGRSYKTAYATPETVMIDDTPDIIEAFNKAGGHGILHKNAGETIEILAKLLTNG